MVGALIIALTLVTLVASACAVGWVRATREAPQGPLDVRPRVSVSLRSEAEYTVAGALWERTADDLILRDAEARYTNGSVAPIDGEIFIPRDDVQLIQVTQ